MRRISAMHWPAPDPDLDDLVCVARWVGACCAYAILERRSVRGVIDQAQDAFEQAVSDGHNPARAACDTLCHHIGFEGVQAFAAQGDLDAVLRAESLLRCLAGLGGVFADPEKAPGHRLSIGGGAQLLSGGHNCLAMWQALVELCRSRNLELVVEVGDHGSVLDQLQPEMFEAADSVARQEPDPSGDPELAFTAS